MVIPKLNKDILSRRWLNAAHLVIGMLGMLPYVVTAVQEIW